MNVDNLLLFFSFHNKRREFNWMDELHYENHSCYGNFFYLLFYDFSSSLFYWGDFHQHKEDWREHKESQKWDDKNVKTGWGDVDRNLIFMICFRILLSDLIKIKILTHSRGSGVNVLFALLGWATQKKAVNSHRRGCRSKFVPRN